MLFGIREADGLSEFFRSLPTAPSFSKLETRKLASNWLLRLGLSYCQKWIPRTPSNFRYPVQANPCPTATISLSFLIIWNICPLPCLKPDHTLRKTPSLFQSTSKCAVTARHPEQSSWPRDLRILQEMMTLQFLLYPHRQYLSIKSTGLSPSPRISQLTWPD